MTFAELKEAIEAAGYEAESYSGRGMYGKACVAFDTEDSTTDVILNLSLAAPKGAESITDTLRGIKTDALGLGTVYYFPRFKWEK